MIDHFEQPTKRVLIIDDNQSIHNDFRQILNPSSFSSQLDTLAAGLFEDAPKPDSIHHNSYELDFALQGDEGIEKVRQSLLNEKPFALAFVDMRMPPGMDGMETIENIWKLDPDIQTVICTAYSDYSYDEIARRLGKSGNLVILRKPFDNIEVAQLADTLTTKWEQNKLRQRSQERLELALKGANLGLWEWDFKNRRFSVDDQWMDIFGYRLEEIENGLPHWETLVHPADQPEYNQYLTQTAPFYKITCRMRTKSGDWKHILERGKIVQRDAKGRPARITGTHLDVTSHVQAQSSLQESEEKWRSLVMSAPEIIVMANADGKIISINRGFQGFEQDQIPGMSIYDFIKPVCAQPVSQCVERVSTTLSTSYCSIESADPQTGEPIFYEAHIGPVKNKQGRLAAITMVITDITRRKLTEEKLIEAKDAAVKANLAKSRFLATMSHEIRTPLTALIGYSDLLLKNQVNPGQARQWTRNLRSNADHLHTLVNDILDLSKIEANELKLKYEDRSTIEVFEETLFAMKPIAIEKTLELNIIYKNQLPKSFITDHLRYRQILFNLIGNAIKFTRKGFVKIHVSTEIHAGQCILQTAVQDTGIGISETDLHIIFEPFTQLDMSDKRTYGGAGLGLDISRRLAYMLGGNLSATSKPNEGSTFAIHLPIGPADRLVFIEPHEVDKLKVEKQRQMELSDQLRDVRILLVEDNYDNQQILLHFLQEAGARVDLAQNGLIGLKHVEAAEQSGMPYQIVLMDMQMPVMDGYTAIEKIREQRLDLPVIALTAYTMAGDEDRCMESGCNGYLGKPIEQDKLIATIVRHLENKTDPINVDRLVSDWKPGIPDSHGLYPAVVTNPRFTQILEEYLDRLGQSVVQLEESRKHNDLEGLGKMVHRLKGSAASYGYPEISNLAGICEKRLREGGLMQDVEKPLDRLVELMRSVSQTSKPKRILHGEKSC